MLEIKTLVGSKENIKLCERVRYDSQGMNLGRNLLSYILEHKEITERYFHFQTNKSTLCYIDDKSKRIYEKLGYVEYDPKNHMMEKMLVKK